MAAGVGLAVVRRTRHRADDKFTTMVPRDRGVGRPATCPCEPMESEDLCLPMYTSGRPRAEGDRAHDRRLPRRSRRDARDDLRPRARAGRVLVCGRHRLDHRAQLHRLRAVVQRSDVRDVRRHSGLPESRALVGDRRALRGDDAVHGADRDQGAHEVGARARSRPRSLDVALLGSVGEPINPEAWMWYHEHIGGERAPSSIRGGRRRPGW